MKKLGLKAAAASVTIAALLMGSFAAYGRAFADTASANPDVLPNLSDSGAWHLETAANLYIRAGELRMEAPNTFGALVEEVDVNDSEAEITTQNPIHLIDGHTYTLTLRARADGIHPIRIYAQTGDRHTHYVGLNASASPGFPYETIRKTFVARNVGGEPVKFAIAIGSVTGRVWVQDLTLTDDTPTATPTSAS